VKYFRCPACQFLQTEYPYWPDEAYSSAISDLDLGSVNRATSNSTLVEGTILLGFNPKAKFVDWGGGYGILTRLMRDRGFDFYWRDRYCENLFAKQFIASSESKYELLTAFEVFEHLANPIEDIGAMKTWASNILFSTNLQPRNSEALEDWWYLTREHGQHVSLYSTKSLKYLANRFALHLQSDGSSIHLLSQEPISPLRFKAMTSGTRAARLVRKIARRRANSKSLLIDDFRNVTGWNV
jgi:hypothetical protein